MKLEPTRVPVTALLLDANKYRFCDLPSWNWVSESRFRQPGVQAHAANLLKTTPGFDVAQLRDSIRINGLVPLERIVVRPYPHDAEKYVVVEGNRRVAAIQWLLELQETGGEDLADRGDSLRELEVLLLDPSEAGNTDAAQVLMAIRHVGGIKDWKGYPQALLILERMQRPGATFTNIGSELAMSPREVGRLYRAAKALQQMQEDEEYGDLAKPTLHALFQETFVSSEVKDWLDWDEANSRYRDTDNLREFYSWITESDDRPTQIRTTQDIRQHLKAIIPRPRALNALKSGDATLEEAKRMAEEDANAGRPGTDLDLALTGATRALGRVSITQVPNLTEAQRTLLSELRANIDTILRAFDRLSE